VSDEDSLKSDSLSKQETDKLFQMLELKLGHERVAWKRAKSQMRVVRTASILFLFLLIVAALAAGYFVFYRTQELCSNKTEQRTLPEP
jgi:hypothetical protein